MAERRERMNSGRTRDEKDRKRIYKEKKPDYYWSKG